MGVLYDDAKSGHEREFYPKVLNACNFLMLRPTRLIDLKAPKLSVVQLNTGFKVRHLGASRSLS